MDYCKICDIITNPKTLDDKIIYENELVIVKVAKGMVVIGHLLVIPKSHINGLADFSPDIMIEVYKFCKQISSKLKEYMDSEVVLFEHGSLPQGRHPTSIVHSHIHIIPYNLSKESYKVILDGCQLEKIDNIDLLQNAKQSDYWYFEDTCGTKYLSYDRSNVPRSIIFKVIAKQEGLSEEYEWHDESNNDVLKVKTTLEIGYRIFENFDK